jgi:hypothetical protein
MCIVGRAKMTSQSLYVTKFKLLGIGKINIGCCVLEFKEGDRSEFEYVRRGVSLESGGGLV